MKACVDTAVTAAVALIKKAKRSDEGYIYCLRAPSVERFKIGMSRRHPEGRLIAQATASPVDLEMIGWIPGGVTLEENLHFALRDLRWKREWFDEPCDCTPIFKAIQEKQAELFPAELVFDPGVIFDSGEPAKEPPPTISPKPFYTIGDVASILQVSNSMVADGLTGLGIDTRSGLISVEDANRWIRSCCNQ